MPRTQMVLVSLTFAGYSWNYWNVTYERIEGVRHTHTPCHNDVLCVWLVPILPCYVSIQLHNRIILAAKCVVHYISKYSPEHQFRLICGCSRSDDDDDESNFSVWLYVVLLRFTALILQYERFDRPQKPPKSNFNLQTIRNKSTVSKWYICDIDRKFMHWQCDDQIIVQLTCRTIHNTIRSNANLMILWSLVCCTRCTHSPKPE